MFIKSGFIFGETENFRTGDIEITDNKITRISFDSKEQKVNENEIDAIGMYVIPGLVDIHMHGCDGVDFCDATDDVFRKIEEYQLKHGITNVFPATMTVSVEELREIFRAAGEYNERSKNVLSGITMEGPFISNNKKGAQNGKYIQKPDVNLYREMQSLCKGLISQVAVAPEEDTDLRFILETSKEVVVSVAHTTADYEMAEKAFSSGATHVTHLFNGMNLFSHREPGVIGAAFDNKEVFVELICDGVHIHPSMVRVVFELFGAKRICMISDSMRATGMRDGKYTLGGQKVVVQNNIATLEDGTIAGGICNLYQCLKKAVLEMEIPLEEAILSCTKTPAKSLGVDDKCGVLAEGRNADILILDKNLDIRYVIKNGVIIA